MFLNRTLCDVLEEMRKTIETRNFSYLGGLIEEVQVMGNRMEAKIELMKDEEGLRKSIKKLEEDLDNLRSEKRKLSGKLDDWN